MITAVNNVSFKNNYNNLNFEGKKKERPQHEPRQSSSALKAIPLATLIAMSPLNVPSATNAFGQGPEKIVAQDVYTDKYTNEKFQLFFYDMDGDRNTAEKVQIGTFRTVVKNQLDLDTRKRVPIECYVLNELKLDTLKQVNVTTVYESGSESTNHIEFFIVGEGSVVQTPMIAQDGSGKVIRPKSVSKYPDHEIKIPPAFYQYLDELTNGTIPKKVENRTAVISIEHEYLYGM